MQFEDRVFRALSDPTRRRALVLLHREGRLCVCELVAALAVPQVRVSRHLGRLREMGLVTDERRQQWMHYRLAGDLPDWVMALLAATAEGEAAELAAMRERLATVARPALAPADAGTPRGQVAAR